MDNRPYPVKVHCPFFHKEETVFFYPVEHQGNWYVRFNGCDNLWHDCAECKECQEIAYKKLTSTSE